MHLQTLGEQVGGRLVVGLGRDLKQPSGGARHGLLRLDQMRHHRFGIGLARYLLDRGELGVFGKGAEGLARLIEDVLK